MRAMYKRETPNQFKRRLRQMNAEKRLTKNQLLWEEEARKLRNRLAAAEKKGYGFAEDLVPKRPSVVRKKDIEALRKIKGERITSQTSYIDYAKLQSGAIKKNPFSTYSDVYVGYDVNKEPIITPFKDVAPTAVSIPVERLEEALQHDAFDDPMQYLEWRYPRDYDPFYSDDTVVDDTGAYFIDYYDTDDENLRNENTEDNETLDPQERYYQENPERELDNAINVDIGEAVIENAYSLIETQAVEIDTWSVSNNIKEIKRDAGSRLKSLLDGAISVFGRRTVAYNLQNYGAETFTQYVERALFYVAAYSDSATDTVTNAALNDIRDILFRDDPGMAASYDFEDYDNV